jgi:S-adenosylmethionine:tRNA ribosyltransferase-isomerase
MPILLEGPAARSGDVAGSAVASRVEVTVRRVSNGSADVAFPPGVDVAALAEEIGEPPLPPYIRRPAGPLPDDRERYQTIFASEPGSIAAPTAGLHLTRQLLARLRERHIRFAELLLHVGPSTFLAGRSGGRGIALEPERYTLPAATAEAVHSTKGHARIVAVGTTTTRALESAARAGWPTGEQQTTLFLKPGSRFAVIDALLTNFHLPGSSLLALVSGFAGVEHARAAYREAVEARYRFYSYGDAMLIV